MPSVYFHGDFYVACNLLLVMNIDAICYRNKCQTISSFILSISRIQLGKFDMTMRNNSLYIFYNACIRVSYFQI